MFCFRCPLIMHNPSVYQRSVCRPIWTQPYKVPVFQTLLYILSSGIVLIQLSLPNSPLPSLATQKAFPKPTFSHCLLLRRKCAGASVIWYCRQIFHHHSIMKSVGTLHVGQNVRLVYSLVEARSQNGRGGFCLWVVISWQQRFVLSMSMVVIYDQQLLI